MPIISATSALRRPTLSEAISSTPMYGKTSVMAMAAESVYGLRGGLKQVQNLFGCVRIPFFNGSESGSRFVKRLKILLWIQIQGQNYNTYIGVAITRFAGTES